MPDDHRNKNILLHERTQGKQRKCWK